MLPVGTLLAVFGLLLCRSAAVCSSDVLLFLGLGLYLTLVGVFPFTATAKGNAILQDFLKVLFASHILWGLMGPIGLIGLMGLMGLIGPIGPMKLMVEQSYARECHGDAILVTSHNDMVVAHRAAGLGNKLHTALVGTLDIVAKGEESI